MTHADPVAPGTSEARLIAKSVGLRIREESVAKIATSKPGARQWPISSTTRAPKPAIAKATREATTPTPPKPLTFRERVARMWETTIRERGELDLQQASREFTEAIRNDPSLLDQFVHDMLVRTLVEIGTRTVSAIEGAERVGTHVHTIAHLRAKVQAMQVTWIELDPLTKVHVPLLDMNRAQLTAAVVRRAREAHEHAEIANWLLLIADRMQPGQTVQQACTPTELRLLRGVAAQPNALTDLITKG